MRVVVLGLGQYPKGSGIVTALFVAKRGDEVIVVEPHYTPAMDENIKRLNAFSNVQVITGDIKPAAVLKGVELVIRHQRLRRDEPVLVVARRAGIPIETELSLFLKQCPAVVIGVTGTRGKSTTTALIHEILTASRKWHKVWLAGNILASPLLDLVKMKANDIVVLEMSSFQLEGTGDGGVSPQIAVWTNLMRDHLNVYPDMEEYAEAKAQIFRHQQMNDLVFLPQEKAFDDYASQAPSDVYRFGKKGSEERKLVQSVALKLRGTHNQLNAEIATAVALQLDIPVSVVKRALRAFIGLPNRQQEVAVIKGVHYINDTTATTPDATMTALQTFATQGRIHLIVGGADKELVFDEVAGSVKRLAASVMLLPGTAHEKIVAAFTKKRVRYQDVADMQEAVEQIQGLVQNGDYVLLSPGCASFGLFQNEYHRGQIFVRSVQRLQRTTKRK